MVNSWTGEWTPEKDYTNYPKEKMCDMDEIYIGLKKMFPDFIPKTSWKNVINLILCYFYLDDAWKEMGYEDDSIDSILAYAYDSSPLDEFDFEV